MSTPYENSRCPVCICMALLLRLGGRRRVCGVLHIEPACPHLQNSIRAELLSVGYVSGQRVPQSPNTPDVGVDKAELAAQIGILFLQRCLGAFEAQVMLPCAVVAVLQPRQLQPVLEAQTLAFQLRLGVQHVVALDLFVHQAQAVGVALAAEGGQVKYHRSTSPRRGSGTGAGASWLRLADPIVANVLWLLRPITSP